MTAATSSPIGAAVSLDELARDPYPVYAALQEREPVSRIAALDMWWVTRYGDVDEILRDAETYTTASDHSTIYDTFGAHMLTVEGALHARYKDPLRRPFNPAAIRARMEAHIRARVDALIDGFAADGRVELRSAFAARLPVQVTLLLFGLPLDAEGALRGWYDSFERALSNFTWDAAVRRAARDNVATFHALLQRHMDDPAGADDGSLLALMTGASDRLEDEEIKRNASIIFFGGISTVEALILNSLYALLRHPETLARLRDDPALMPSVIEETMRWMSPVQSATRHVTKDTSFRGVEFKAGDIVNCMIGAANRDPRLFPQPEVFDIGRPNLRRHLGFATGPHHCLGSHLAKAECRIALERLLAHLPDLEFDPQHEAGLEGYEFRQPRALHLRWRR